MAIKIFNIEMSLMYYEADTECVLVRKSKASQLDALPSAK